MSNGSRQSDAVSHGGTIATGSPNVLTEGLATARLADLVACAAHGAAVIGGSSSTVLVNGRGFARINDGCICGGGATAGPGTRDLVLFLLTTHESGKTVAEVLRETNGVGPHFEGVGRDTNNDGVHDTIALTAGLARINLEGDAGHFRMEAFTAEAEVGYAEGPAGFSLRAKGEANAIQGDAQLNLGDRASVRGKGGLFNARAGYDVLVGDDGRRVGAGGSGGAVASVAEGEIGGSATGTVGEYIAGPFAPLLTRGVSALSPSAARALSTPVKIEAAVSGSAVSAGAEGTAEAYYDRQTGQATAAVGGKIAALLGLGFDLRITVGEDQSKSRDSSDSQGATGGAGPNLIAAGAGTVLVGD